MSINVKNIKEYGIKTVCFYYLILVGANFTHMAANFASEGLIWP